MCDTFILLKYIKDNNIKKITINLDIDVDVDIDVDDKENKDHKDYDIAPQKDNYYSMLCFKDLRMFAPHVVTEIYISKKIENSYGISSRRKNDRLYR